MSSESLPLCTVVVKGKDSDSMNPYLEPVTKNHLNLTIKTEPVSAGVDSTVYVRLLFAYTLPKNLTYLVVSAPAVAVSVFTVCRDSDFLGSVYSLKFISFKFFRLLFT